MSARRNMVGLMVAALGAGGLALDLFNDWYSFRIPDEFLSSATQASSQFGAFGGFIREAASALSHTSLKLSAWDALTRLHVVLMILAVGALSLALLAYTDRLQGGGALLTGVGAIASLLVLYRAVAPPGPVIDGHMLLHATSGAWLGLLASATILAGGVIESRSGAGASQSASSRQPGWLPPEAMGPAPGSFGAATVPGPVAFGAPPALGGHAPAGGPVRGAAATDAPGSSQSTGWTPPEFFT